jgi:Tol biopolymer transport system component
MKKIKGIMPINRTIPIIPCFVLIVFLFLSPLIGCATMDQGKTDFIRNVSFSPDGKKILFNRRNGDRISMIHVYDLESGELIAYRSLVGEEWFQAQYSFDGKHIVFVTMPLIGHQEDPANSQIAVMDPDGKNVRKITNTTGFKVYPSFSHSGRKIIFARADVIREKGARTPVADYDVYEVDVGTGKETRLTQFKFFEMSKPYYFPDDKTFIFWGESPRVYPGIPDDGNRWDIYKKVQKINNDLHSKYQNNSIYVMKGNEKELKPYIVMPEYQKKFKMYVKSSEYSRLPSLSADGSVLIFAAQGYKTDGSADFEHLYQYSSDGNHRNITQHPATIWDVAVSPNNKLLAVIHEPKQDINNIVIYRVSDGSISKDITLPDQPSHMINGQGLSN